MSAFALSFLLYLSISSQALIQQKNQIDARSAQQSQQLAKRLLKTFKQNNNRNVITVNQREINGLTALLHRAFPVVSADIQLSEYGANTKVAIELPLPAFMRYLNISADVLPSTHGLSIAQVSFGDIRLRGDTFLTIANYVASYYVQENVVEKALKMISAVEVNEHNMKVSLNLDSTLFADNNEKSLLVSLRDDLALFGDVDKISFYYQSLNNFASTQKHNVSIAVFIRHLFELAKMRCAISDGYVATVENQAAITALVIYFGADRFELLVGDIIIRDYGSLVIRNRLRSIVTLQGRADLQKHFIYSMAFQLFSTHGASDAIGEYKEFLDTNKGGSGFSFADLLADRAGTRLAMIVSKSAEHGKQAQRILSSITDKQLLPSIKGLEEGINEDAFDKNYRSVQSNRYQNALNNIDNRLKKLGFYRLGW